MMNWKWIVNGQQLQLITSDGEVIVPIAADVLACLHQQHNLSSLPEGCHPLSPADDLPGIRFSSLGVKLVLLATFNNEINQLVISAYIRKGQKKHLLTQEIVNLSDHIVIDNVWHYINVSTEDVKTFLLKNGIAAFGQVTLAQYLKIKKSIQKNPFIDFEDRAEEELSNHPLSDEANEMPSGLTATLYPYQQKGFGWLKFMASEQCGCILGDEMGLGKTLQVIALIVSRKTIASTPALIIAPVSLLENWRREFAKFSVGMNVYVHHGSKRTGLYKVLLQHDVIIMSYNTACSDQALLKMIIWDTLVIDEAQNIKNPDATRTLSIKAIRRNTAIAVTGTPFENHVTDLWSLMDFAIPGCLGTLGEFEKEVPDDAYGARIIEPYLTPIMLRRVVSEVANDLPERIDVPQALVLSEDEASAYEQTREDIIKANGNMRATLPLLQKLRMYCTHPFLLYGTNESDPIRYSTKYERMCELLEEIKALGEKTLLFTSYNRMFDILLLDIPKRLQIPVYAINGSTPQSERQAIIDSFSITHGSALLVLNPRAAGTGLNITAASRVIHYNLEWNPALEDQASARAYRRGQKKNVFIYRLFYQGTVEEIINDRIEKKREMFDEAIVGVDGSDQNTEDIMRALTISPLGGKNE